MVGRRNFGEADRILTVFSNTQGKITLIAKGVRKTTSRKRGGIEIFTKIKFSAIKGKSMDILTEVNVLDGFDAIRNDLNKIGVAYYFCEVMAKVTREEEKSDKAYEILDSEMQFLKARKDLKAQRLKFVEDVLVTVGFWPDGKKMTNPDAVLESVTERKINSFRVGRKMLQQG